MYFFHGERKKSVTIPMGIFESFSRGEKVNIDASRLPNPRPNDRFSWECGSSHSGDAEVVGVEDQICFIRKLT